MIDHFDERYVSDLLKSYFLMTLSLEFEKSTDEQQIVNKYKDCLSFTLTKAVQIKAT